MGRFTRGFLGRGRRERDPGLPPGQYDAEDDWPVLNAEVTPRLSTDDWTFTVEGLVARETAWTWDEIHALPNATYEGDIHCVTTWSKLGVNFSGVSVDTLLAAAQPVPAATHVLAFSHTGYTTNLPLADVTGGRARVVWDFDGRPLARQHGAPARLVVSVRSPADLYYADELPGPESEVVYTRQAPPASTRPAGRITADDLAPAPITGATTYICGSDGFADAASELLMGLGVTAESIRVERFGPTG